MTVSIFNDVIGPVMRGASSSHCAAALRIGRLARDLMEGEISDVLIEFDRTGSLPTTHESQGSDMGLFGGLLGWDADDERLPNSASALNAAGITTKFVYAGYGDVHPNTYRLTLTNYRETHSLIAISTGGGMIELLEIDGTKLSMFGDYFETLLWGKRSQIVAQLSESGFGDLEVVGELVRIKSNRFVDDVAIECLRKSGDLTTVKRLHPVLPVLSRPGIEVPFTTCNELLAYDAGQSVPLWRYGLQYEMARGDLTEQQVLEKMVDIVRILRKSIASGLAGTHYEDRVLGWQSGGFQELMQAGKLLDGGALNKIVLYVTAMMEVKSSMGVIVAMPTAGACAALPGAVIAMAEELGLGEEEMAKALLASGLIGVFIATAWSFAAEVGGCQAEGGSAASMAAAALITLAGGTLKQAVGASSMALQSMIGLICDPIANRVEAPCLGKNVMAAANALCTANISLAGFDQVIPLDEVIETAKRVSAQMPRELRCTSLGGLSITPTSRAIEFRLKENAARSCSC
ncbi:MAG: L-serine ammonia-lyase, iron-sulfur-dependent, subunit alpha [Chthonomonadales bacterium]